MSLLSIHQQHQHVVLPRPPSSDATPTCTLEAIDDSLQAGTRVAGFLEGRSSQINLALDASGRGNQADSKMVEAYYRLRMLNGRVRDQAWSMCVRPGNLATSWHEVLAVKCQGCRGCIAGSQHRAITRYSRPPTVVGAAQILVRLLLKPPMHYRHPTLNTHPHPCSHHLCVQSFIFVECASRVAGRRGAGKLCALDVMSPSSGCWDDIPPLCHNWPHHAHHANLDQKGSNACRSGLEC
jgi:hypothetical protein